MTKDTMFSLDGKKAVVTGGAMGIGKVVSMYMAMMGADIAIIDILKDLADEVADEIAKTHGVKAKAYDCDVRVPSQVEAAIDQISDDFGDLDVLFNNAGIVLHKAGLDLTVDEWTGVFDTNTHGVFYVARAFAKKLIEQNRPGSIINNASISAIIVNYPQEQISYNASKAAVVQMTKSMAVEWFKYGIRVNSLSPGYTFTDLTKNVRSDWVDKWIELTPYKRMAKPEELAGAVIYLASDCASFTSGCDIVVDGAFSCV